MKDIGPLGVAWTIAMSFLIIYMSIWVPYRLITSGNLTDIVIGIVWATFLLVLACAMILIDSIKKD